MSRIIVNEDLATGEFTVHLEQNDKLRLDTSQSCFTEETVHAIISDIVHDDIGKFLTEDDCIVHTKWDEDSAVSVERVNLIEYLEN